VFASNIAVAFENLSLIERLDQLAYVDSMLGIPNRNAFEVDYIRHKKQHKHLSVLLVHINGLSQSSRPIRFKNLTFWLENIYNILKMDIHKAFNE
jgi:hypothetical protein